MADHVQMQLADEGITDYAIVGLSLGGMVALEMAGRWPAAVTHLAMIESVPNVTDNHLIKSVSKGVIFLLGHIGPKFLTYLPFRLLGAETDAAGTYLKAALRRMNRQNIAAVMTAALEFDGRGFLPDLTMPTLVMVGERSRKTHAPARWMADRIPNAQFLIAPRAGHIANIDAPEFVNQALGELLD